MPGRLPITKKLNTAVKPAISATTASIFRYPILSLKPPLTNGPNVNPRLNTSELHPYSWGKEEEAGGRREEGEKGGRAGR
jgi:hypothetical protein